MPLSLKFKAYLEGTTNTIAGVSILMTDLKNGLKRMLHTDVNGECIFALLPSGDYEIKSSATGFETNVFTFHLEDGLALTHNIILKQAGCTKAPEEWQCTRGYHPDGPCAAVPKETTRKSPEVIIAGLEEECARAMKAQVYGFFMDGPPTFVQGDQAGEVCEIVTADDLNRWFPRDGVILNKEEAIILQKLLRGIVVGPAARAVLDKINAVKA